MPGSPQCPSRPECSSLRIDSASVVADQDSQLPVTVFEFDFDALRARMPEGIDQSFPADPVDLVAQHRMQRPWLAVHDHAKSDIVVDCEFILDVAKTPVQDRVIRHAKIAALAPRSGLLRSPGSSIQECGPTRTWPANPEGGGPPQHAVASTRSGSLAARCHEAPAQFAFVRPAALQTRTLSCLVRSCRRRR